MKRKSTDKKLTGEQRWLLFIVTIIVLLLTIEGIETDYSARLSAQKSEARIQAEDIIMTVQSELDNSVDATEMLKNLYIVYGDYFLKDFYKICDAFCKSNVTIGSMYFAPDATIKYAYPFEVDEATEGFAMLEDPVQGPKARLALESRQVTVAGPHDLIEGGQGFIVRNPLYDENGKFLAFTILILDKDQFMNQIFSNLSSNGRKYEFAIWKDNDTTSVVDENGYIVSTNQQVLDTDIVVDFEVPNDIWHMAVAPTDGWYKRSDMWLDIIFLSAIGVAVLAAMYLWLRNIRNRQLMEQRVINSIEIDELTGLYTKQAFYHYAQAFMNQHPNETFDLVMTDIRNFKLLNSIYGDDRGDELLKHFAAFISDVSKDGVCARYGGDQFVVLFIADSDDKNIWIKNLLDEYLKISPIENLSVKIGVYENVDRSLSISHMCDRASLAIKSIKSNYDRNLAFFDGPVSQQELKAARYEARFQKAIEKKEFVVWLQPKYDIDTERVIGAEALVRWNTEEGMISPGQFLQVFEGDGLIGELDAYVFRTVCELQQRWMAEGRTLMPISVNLSRNSMHRSNLVELYKNIVEECGISPKNLAIEITESAAIGTKEIKPFADAFYEAGFTLHMDDFGSGRSSLNGLNLLHFSVLKLDKSLVDFIGDKHGDLLLMYTIALAKELGLHITAEGVEDADQIAFLKENGCDSVQGYYYSKPLPIDEFEQKIYAQMDSEPELSQEKRRYPKMHFSNFFKHTMDRMLYHMPGGFFVYEADEEEKILLSNPYLWKLYGCETEEEFMEYVHGSFKGIVCPEEYEEVEASIWKQIHGNMQGDDHVSYHIVRKDGTRVRVVDYGQIEHDSNGDVFYVFINEVENGYPIRGSTE